MNCRCEMWVQFRSFKSKVWPNCTCIVCVYRRKTTRKKIHHYVLTCSHVSTNSSCVHKYGNLTVTHCNSRLVWIDQMTDVCFTSLFENPSLICFGKWEENRTEQSTRLNLRCFIKLFQKEASLWSDLRNPNFVTTALDWPPAPLPLSFSRETCKIWMTADLFFTYFTYN